MLLLGTVAAAILRIPLLSDGIACPNWKEWKGKDLYFLYVRKVTGTTYGEKSINETSERIVRWQIRDTNETEFQGRPVTSKIFRSFWVYKPGTFPTEPESTIWEDMHHFNGNSVQESKDYLNENVFDSAFRLAESVEYMQAPSLRLFDWGSRLQTIPLQFPDDGKERHAGDKWEIPITFTGLLPWLKVNFSLSKVTDQKKDLSLFKIYLAASKATRGRPGIDVEYGAEKQLPVDLLYDSDGFLHSASLQNEGKLMLSRGEYDFALGDFEKEAKGEGRISYMIRRLTTSDFRENIERFRKLKS